MKRHICGLVDDFLSMIVNLYPAVHKLDNWDDNFQFSLDLNAAK